MLINWGLFKELQYKHLNSFSLVPSKKNEKDLCEMTQCFQKLLLHTMQVQDKMGSTASSTELQMF